jgi:hypothetical protein
MLLDRLFPDWEERLDWSLLLERRSFLYLFISIISLVFLLLVRAVLARLADHYLQVPRFHLRANLGRALMAFRGTPQIK